MGELTRLAVPLVAFLLVVKSASPAPAGTHGLGSQSEHNVTVSIGQVATLVCDLAKSDRNAMIIWTIQYGERQDILAAGEVLVVRDARYSLRRDSDGNLILTIRNTRPSDSLVYRCQVGTTALVNKRFNLHVVGCKDNEFACGDGLMCIERTRRCDGITTCPEAEDELKCRAEECKGPSVYCGDGRCVLLEYFCDGRDDCGNGFDEANCSTQNTMVCSSREFTCGDRLCVPASMRCDGIVDCLDGTDELNCTVPTTSAPTTEATDDGVHTLTSRNDVTAFVGKTAVLVCPIETDKEVAWSFHSKPLTSSSRGSDGRWQLTIKNVQRANAGMYVCRVTSEPSVRSEVLVLNVMDKNSCSDTGNIMSGRKNCTSKIRGSGQKDCPEDFWSCGDGTCTPRSWWCDGEQDCATAADERACTVLDCQPETTYCGDGRCEKGGRCDGKDDCAKSSNPGFDEKDCTASQCFPGARYCGNGHCVASYMICDGVDQCGNGADEKFCAPFLNDTTPTTTTSTPITIAPRLVEEPDRDDGNKDLLRALIDSLSVQKKIAVTVWRTCRFQLINQDRGLCPTGKFHCGYDCVDMAKRCDGVSDCEQNTDEANCHLIEEACGPAPA